MLLDLPEISTFTGQLRLVYGTLIAMAQERKTLMPGQSSLALWMPGHPTGVCMNRLDGKRGIPGTGMAEMK